MDEERSRRFLLELISESLESGHPIESVYSNYGYDVYVPNVVINFMAREEKTAFDEHDLAHKQRREELSQSFYDAAWELCRLGILRPGVRRFGLQSTELGSAGNGYSITAAASVRINEVG